MRLTTGMRCVTKVMTAWLSLITTQRNEPFEPSALVRKITSSSVATAVAYGVKFLIPATPHTFRHSYDMHMFYNGIPLKVLQSLMGHKSVSSIEVYTKVFALDMAAWHRVQFQMHEGVAVAMLKGIG